MRRLNGCRQKNGCHLFRPHLFRPRRLMVAGKKMDVTFSGPTFSGPTTVLCKKAEDTYNVGVLRASAGASKESHAKAWQQVRVIHRIVCQSIRSKSKVRNRQCHSCLTLNHACSLSVLSRQDRFLPAGSVEAEHKINSRGQPER